MHITKTLIAAALVATTSSSAFAESHAPEVMDAEVDTQATPNAIKPEYIVLGIVAALFIATQLKDSEDNTEEPTVEQPPQPMPN